MAAARARRGAARPCCPPSRHPAHPSPPHPLLQHWLPNFNECWWDSWVLDVALCNAIGIFTGGCMCVRACVRARAWQAGCGGCLAGWLAGMPAAAVGTGSSQASWASRASGSRGPGRVCPPPHLALLLPVFLPSPSTHPALLAAFLPPPPPHWALLAVFLPPPGRHVDRAPLWQQALQLARAEPAADTAGQGATGPGSVHPCHLGPARLGHLQIPHPPAAVLLPGWARVQVVWVGEGAVLVLRACGLGELVGWGGSRAFRPPHTHALSCSDRPSPPGVPTHLPCRGDHPAAV